MRPDDLRTFVHLLEQADQLARVAATVDPYLELATITAQVSKGRGENRALLFEQVSGSTLPVAANLFGSAERVAWALGTTDIESLAQRLEFDLQATGEGDPLRALQLLSDADAWQQTLVSQPPWREHAASPLGLDLLPMIKAWPGDGGTYLTLPQVFTRHPDGGKLNCGMYRVQHHGRFAATLRCRGGSGAARHLSAWHDRGAGMPVAMVLGGPPVLTWAAGTPLPDMVDEVAFSGYLTGAGLAMSSCMTSDLQVPASAEIVIEGIVEPGSTAVEGPFGNHTGGYDTDPQAPLIRVLAVHARATAMYPWTLVGPPPMENLHLARATERLFLPLIKMVLPTLRGLHMPAEGIFHRAAVITVDPGEDRPLSELAALLQETSLLRGSRLLIVGVDDHDPRDPAAVCWRVLNRADWSRDLLIENGRLVIDARRLPPGEPVHCDPTVLAKVFNRWKEYGIG